MEAVPALSQKESTPKLCGGSSPQISKRFRPKILWRQFPPILKKNSPKNSVDQILWRQFPPNLKKNPPLNSVEAVPANSQKEFAQKFCGVSSPRTQKESTPKFCGGSSRRISRRIPPKIRWRYVVPANSQIMEDPQISKRIHP